MADQDPLLEPALKLGQVALHTVGKRHPSLFHHQHQPADAHRLADGGHDVDGIRPCGGRPGAAVQPSESLVEHHPGVAGHQDGGRSHPALGGLLPQPVGDPAEARRRHSHLLRCSELENGKGVGAGGGLGTGGGSTLRVGTAAGEGIPADARQAQGTCRQYLPPGGEESHISVFPGGPWWITLSPRRGSSRPPSWTSLFPLSALRIHLLLPSRWVADPLAPPPTS